MGPFSLGGATFECRVLLAVWSDLSRREGPRSPQRKEDLVRLAPTIDQTTRADQHLTTALLCRPPTSELSVHNGQCGGWRVECLQWTMPVLRMWLRVSFDAEGSVFTKS